MEKAPIATDPIDASVMPAVGDYVLATKYSDGDPGDSWALGFYAGQMPEYTPPRHDVVDSDGKSIRGNGYRRVARIRNDVGAWLLVAAKQLEQSPPGTVNLWTMLTPTAFDVSDEPPIMTPNAQGQWTGAALCARSTAPQGCASGGDER